jgi:hypothetical protein
LKTFLRVEITCKQTKEDELENKDRKNKRNIQIWKYK